ncbi:hypothetical protein WDZ92_35805 [Nostoc sp. NIES-2111]
MSEREPTKVIRVDFRVEPGPAPTQPEPEVESADPAHGPVPDLIALVARVSQVQVAQGEQTATIVQQLLLMNRLLERQAQEIVDLRRRVEQLSGARAAPKAV